MSRRVWRKVREDIRRIIRLWVNDRECEGWLRVEAG